MFTTSLSRCSQSLRCLFPSPRGSLVTSVWLVIASPMSVLAQTDAEMRAEMRALRAELTATMARLAELEARLDGHAPAPSPSPATPAALEAELTQALAADALAAPTPHDERVATPTAAPVNYLDISLVSIFAAGGSTAGESTLRQLHGGAHDPAQRGFTVEQLELTLSGAVDPYFDGQASIIFQIDAEGESLLEVEEAWLRTRMLPHGFQIRAGQYLTEFGRLNQIHPHGWSFVDQPVISTRLLGGDGLRNPGASLSWLAPTPWYSELAGGLQNARGETAASFLAALEDEDAGVGGHPFLAREVIDPSDLLASARWLNSFALTEEIELSLGVSGLFGPNATGVATDTQIYGTDLFLKWQPAGTERGWPFVTLESEAMLRRYEAGSFFTLDEAGEPLFRGADVLWDYGLFAQLGVGFHPGWLAAWRYEVADSRHGIDRTLDPLRDERHRAATSLTWYASEFSKLRLQHNIDWAEHLGPAAEHSLWFQWQFVLGAHGAHGF